MKFDWKMFSSYIHIITDFFHVNTPSCEDLKNLKRKNKKSAAMNATTTTTPHERKSKKKSTNGAKTRSPKERRHNTTTTNGVKETIRTISTISTANIIINGGETPPNGNHHEQSVVQHRQPNGNGNHHRQQPTYNAMNNPYIDAPHGIDAATAVMGVGGDQRPQHYNYNHHRKHSYNTRNNGGGAAGGGGINNNLLEFLKTPKSNCIRAPPTRTVGDQAAGGINNNFLEFLQTPKSNCIRPPPTRTLGDHTKHKPRSTTPPGDHHAGKHDRCRNDVIVKSHSFEHHQHTRKIV